MEKIVIKSFKGIMPFEFGKTYKNLIDVVPQNSRIITKQNVCKVYATPFSLKFVDDILTEISVLETTNVFFEEHNVFDSSFVEYLRSKYASVYKYGSLIFDEVGIALYGFVEIEEQRVISAYSKNSWDSILNK